VNPSGVQLDHEGPVVTLTLIRPDPVEPWLPAVWPALAEVGRGLSGNVRVAIVRGEGAAFDAGGDPVAADGDPQALDWLRAPGLISIAAIQGPATGAGCQLALACDLRILTVDSHFALTEVSWGAVPHHGVTKRLVELIGYSRALEICLTARPVPAVEADRLGLANLVVPAAELDEAARDLAAAVLAAPRDAVIELAALLGGAHGRSAAGQQAAERAAQQRLVDSAESQLRSARWNRPAE